VSEQKQEPNIREYNFAVPGNIDRHIPGIPGMWPAGSIVEVDEDTNQVVSIFVPETTTPAERKELQARIQPDVPPALESEEQAADLAAQLSEAVKHL